MVALRFLALLAATSAIVLKTDSRRTARPTRRALLGGAATLVLPNSPANADVELPPDALKALARYQPTLQIAADTFVFGTGEAVADPRKWEVLPKAIAPGAQFAEASLWGPLNSLALTFLDDELSSRVLTFQLAVKDLAATAANSRGTDPATVPAKAVAKVVKLHTESVGHLQSVFKRVNDLAQPEQPLVASAKARSPEEYVKYVKATAQCQQAGGPMVSVQTSGIVCGPELQVQYLASQLKM
mmetsp:Transcript_12273/g.36482  ORF Transcript_12273/g.36482 Transcript_12273/m.36482 type:complete len:243 (+) Transcript_12273:144-872(+)